jgi:exonuclease III
VLTPPNSTTSFYELPKSQQIGGYPSFSQLADCALDAAVLDSEGRCIVLEFPAFVLIGTYCPANRDETRDEFRIGFLTALDARVRNLVAMGKRVFLTGDLNIIRDEMDTANSEEQLRKQGITIEQYISNFLLVAKLLERGMKVRRSQLCGISAGLFTLHARACSPAGNKRKTLVLGTLVLALTMFCAVKNGRIGSASQISRKG